MNNNGKNSSFSDNKVAGDELNKACSNQQKWADLLERNPGWDKLFARKPELFEPFVSNLEWAERLANDEEWNRLFADCPEWAIVSATELAKIKKRRNRHQPDDNKAQDNTDSNDVKDLVGLAFSGGGIRSASFGLGVLEALKDCDLLNKVDYLSTVSGGGYIGAWLSANCKRTTDDSGKSGWLEKGCTEWNESIKHLRRYSNYLSPEVGFFSADTWTMAAVWLRNTLLVQLTVILGIAVLLLLPPLLLFSLFEWWPDGGNWRWLIIALSILGIAGIAGNNWRLNRDKISSLDSSIWWSWSLLSVVCLIAAIVIAYRFNFNPFRYESELRSPRGFLVVDAVIAFLLVKAGFFVLPGAMKLFNRLDNSKFNMNYTQGMVQWLIVLPTMVIGFFVAAILWHQSRSKLIASWNSFGDYFTQAWEYWPFLLTVMFASLFLLSFCCIRSERNQEQSRTSKALSLLERLVIALVTPLPAMLVLYSLLAVIMLLLHKPLNPRAEAFVWTPLLVSFAFLLTIIMLLGILGRETREGIREWWSRFGAWLAIYGFGGTVVLVVAVYGPGVADASALWWQGILGGSWIGTSLAGVFAGKSGATMGSSANNISVKMLELVAKIAPFVFIAGLLVVVSTVLHFIVMRMSQSYCAGIWSDSGWVTLKPLNDAFRHWDWAEGRPVCGVSPAVAFIVGILCLIGFLLLTWRVDINEFSLDAFYRNRLARCYLGATRRLAERNPQNFTGFDDKDDLPLSDLAESDGPLHIINCSLNLGGSKDLELHTRHSAIFTFTPLYYGSSYRMKGKGLPVNGVEIGYTATNKYSDKHYQPTLGQAIAVSGAAASPNMGYHTSPVTAFLMTLFNARLGGWFPNPRETCVNRSSPRFSMKYLLMELFGLANERSTYLSVSDGGHFENLAAYELVKRKCKVIIISDAECDPKFQFEGLGTLIRMCEVDFGTKIEIDVSSIRPHGKPSWSHNRCAVGKITYKNESDKDKSEGILIYIKASMNGQENTAVMQYKLAHQDFPHDSTADQFYGEDQFESYRSLGYDITRCAFDRVIQQDCLVDPKPDMIDCAKKLKNMFSPILPNIG
ncbi:MAG TPA: patatin-like phospholipase family protein [Methylobacter sp.]|jgi:hypothetical protein